VVCRTRTAVADALEVVRNELTGYDWVYRMMLLALAAKYRQQAHIRAVAELASPGARPLADPSCSWPAAAMQATRSRCKATVP